MEFLVETNLRTSPNLIIDMSRLKKVRSDRVRTFDEQMRKTKHIKKMLLITRQGQIVGIGALI